MMMMMMTTLILRLLIGTLAAKVVLAAIAVQRTRNK